MNRNAKRSILLTALLASVTLADDKPARTWFTSLDNAYLEAQKTGRPILALATPNAGERWIEQVTQDVPLDGFVLLRLDDTRRDDLRSLGIASAPAARLVTPGGAVHARLDRPESSKHLSDWIAKNPIAAQSDDGASVESLIQRLGHAEASVRESAMRKLHASPGSAGAVVEALRSDNLSTRASATELLELWHAPTDGIDPWERSTITPERLAKLSEWASKQKDVPAPTTAPVATVAEEIDRLLGAPMAFEARVVRERLVRYGEPALRAVHERLKTVRTDESRRRLTAARYRLAMSETLAAKGAALIDAVVQGDASSRHRAASELIAMVGADDAALLLELFSDDDAFIRETALRALRQVSGANASAALMKLLADPEPNVRAAVLKTLAEDEEGDESLAEGLASYVAGETDADLVVHAVHVLKNTPGEKSVRTLKDLLAHKQWQVRAEALEAIKSRLGTRYGEKPLPEELASEAYAAVLARLEDDEPFVVSRALATLEGRGMKAALKAIFATIERKPEMAPQLLSMLDKDRETLTTALPTLKTFATHANPKVRAAAIRLLGKVSDGDAGKLLQASVADPDQAVREAGLDAIVVAITRLRPGANDDFRDYGSPPRREADTNTWLDNFRAGKQRPEWLGALAIDQKLLEPLSPAGRANGAIVLAAMGKDEIAIPILHALAGAAPTRMSVVPAMDWLPEDKRLALYAILQNGATPDESQVILQALAKLPSRGAETILWEKLAERTAIDEQTDALFRACLLQYTPQMQARFEPKGEKAWDATVERIATHARTGPEIRRAIAPMVLQRLDSDAAAKEAAAIIENTASPASLRLDAFQIQLLALDGDRADAAAVKQMGDERLRELAIRYLGGGDNAITGGVAGTRLMREQTGYYRHAFFSGNVQERVEVKPPAGLTAEPLRPYLKSSDKPLAGFAGYLLILLDEKEGFGPLEAAFKESDPDDSPFPRLLCRAIARTNDESKLPLLETIYQTYKTEQQYALPEFYWTIRAMTGEPVLKFRKKIRDEVGMARLRGNGF